ncbi:HAD family hydrolase [Actinocorallia populi]|uniref:HAD family hydrolase n=1 Tax=Actinocorallia populi TaxID=2079200 RepID=UPI000D0902DA|nr:HAD family hydrolase [Actinocorallia populi]
MPETISAVLFDIDGTLVDHRAAAAEAVTTTASQDGSPVADALVEQWFALERDAMDRYLAGELTFTEQRRRRVRALANEFALALSDDAAIDAWFARYLTLYENAWRPYPDARPALEALTARPGLRLGVITNGDSAQQHDKLHRTGLADLLPLVIVSSDIGEAKPSPRIFHTACAELAIPPSQALYIGDDYRTDAQAAANAGLHPLWLNRTSIPAPGPLPQIPTLTALALP